MTKKRAVTRVKEGPLGAPTLAAVEEQEKQLALEDFLLPPREMGMLNALKKGGFQWVEELEQKHRKELMAIDGIGLTRATKLRRMLDEHRHE